MKTPETRNRIIFALDVPKLDAALPLIVLLARVVGLFKIGLELFSGPDGSAVVEAVKRAGGQLFLDLKLHDIPETVRRAAKNAAAMGATFITVHALGAHAMLQAAVKGAAEGNPDAKILAVTILTSHDFASLAAIGLVTRNDSERVKYGQATGPEIVSEKVLHLARLAKEAGCHGVIASPQEARMLRAALGPDFLIVTPGIRAAGADTQDQARAGTAYQAAKDGADFFVIGRPIRDAKEPLQAVAAFLDEIERAHAA